MVGVGYSVDQDYGLLVFAGDISEQDMQVSQHQVSTTLHCMVGVGYSVDQDYGLLVFAGDISEQDMQVSQHQVSTTLHCAWWGWVTV